MKDKEEAAWIDGNKAAYRALLLDCARRLGFDDPLSKVAALIAERHDTVVALREVCATHGSNNWEDDSHLADVVEKHLGRQLGNRRKK